MLTRLTHAAIAFAVTAVMYQAYVLAVAPFIEPPRQFNQIELLSAEGELRNGPESFSQYRELLTAYFHPDHWCFARPPKTLENANREVLVVYDSYTQSKTGELRVPRCVILFFPKGRVAGNPPPRDAIILESTGGATLQMEASIDKAVNGLGRMQHGKLEGKVTVRSDMRDPGPADDLLIITHDLYMNEDLMRTDQPVDMRMGPHHGFGRELEIRFMKSEGPVAGTLYGKLEDLVVKHDVSVTVAPGKMSFFGEPSFAAAGHSTTTSARAEGEQSPIRIQSDGPFRIDFGKELASFTEQVRVRQIHPDGKLDSVSAHELKLFFTRTAKWNADEALSPASSSAAPSMAFEPASIEARGSAGTPVVVEARSHDATARAHRLWIELGPRRLTLEEGEEVVLTHRGAEIHAPTIRYQLPPENSGQQVGALAALGGIGRMIAALDPARPDHVLEVHWKQSMQVVRRNGQPVLVLDGRPQVLLAGVGRMWADRLDLHLRETPVDGPDHASNDQASPLPMSVVPEMIVASGRVDIESTELTGKVNQLNVRIDHPAALAATSQEGGAGGANGDAGGGAMSLVGDPGSGGRSYNIAGVTLELDVVMRNRRPEVRGISVDGAVVFEETAAASVDSPLRIEAEHLTVTGADTPNAKIEIRGGGGTNGLPQQIAQIAARGAILRAPALTLHRGTSEGIVDSPGEVELMVDRDLTGNPLPRPEPLAITWRDSMKFEGRRLTFLGDVLVKHSSGWLRTRELVAQMSDVVRFDGAAGQQRPQLEQLECWKGAVAEFDQRDVAGVTSRQHIELVSLTANQRTGAISGEGPGKIDSVHLAKNSSSLLALPVAGAALAPQLVDDEPELRHLHIDFVRGVSGDLRTRTVNVHGNVEAVYGPVDGWGDRQTMSPGGNPGPDVIWITCDQLGVTESPTAHLANPRARQVELHAEGNVVIEGQDKRGGFFNANGHRVNFDQSKGLLNIEGDGVTPATIARQEYLGAPGSPQTARGFEFNLNTRAINVNGLQKGQVNQFDLTRQPGTPASR